MTFIEKTQLVYTTVNFVDIDNFDGLVEYVYGRPYSFQQQDGCKERGIHRFEVPVQEPYDFEDDEIPEIVNGDVMGVSFRSWLARDPKSPLRHNGTLRDDYGVHLFWERNFYPNLDMIVQDLYEKGLIQAGKYVINIDW